MRSCFLGQLNWMIKKYYECFIPKIKSSLKSEDQEIDKTKSIDSYLLPLAGKCLYKMEHWWNYEFCFGKHVKQYHIPQQGEIIQYFLGLYKEGETKFSLYPNYVSETYKSGTICDLTGKPRQIEIRYRCVNEVNFISQWKETSSCHYVLYIDTYLLCSHPAYKPQSETIDKLNCFEGPLYSLEDVKKLIEQRKLLESKEFESNPKSILYKETIDPDETEIFVKNNEYEVESNLFEDQQDQSDTQDFQMYTMNLDQALQFYKNLQENEYIDQDSITDIDEENKEELINLFKKELLKHMVKKLSEENDEDAIDPDTDEYQEKKQIKQ